MALFFYQTGKKIHELLSPNRKLNIFGNDFNPPFGNFGISPPNVFEIISPDLTTTFAMNGSPFPQPQHGGHEVLGVVWIISDIPVSTSFTVTTKHFNADNTLVFTQVINITTPSTGGPFITSSFSFTGWKHTAPGVKEHYKNDTGSSTSTRIEWAVTGDLTDTNTTFIDITNASPNPMTQADADSKGFLWIDDSSNELMHTDGFGFVHNKGIEIESTSAAAGAIPGFIWIPSAGADHGKILYTSTGLKHTTKKATLEDTLTPFTSTKHGFIWHEDDGLHANYISFIADDGNRYIISDGTKNGEAF